MRSEDPETATRRGVLAVGGTLALGGCLGSAESDTTASHSAWLLGGAVYFKSVEWGTIEQSRLSPFMSSTEVEVLLVNLTDYIGIAPCCVVLRYEGDQIASYDLEPGGTQAHFKLSKFDESGEYELVLVGGGADAFGSSLTSGKVIERANLKVDTE